MITIMLASDFGRNIHIFNRKVMLKILHLSLN